MKSESKKRKILQKTISFPSKVKKEVKQVSKVSNFHSINLLGLEIKFPFKSPYPSQFQVMSKLITCLRNSTNGIMESPTGTGKTLSILTSAITWQEKEKSLQYLERTEQRKALEARKTDSNVKIPEMRRVPKIFITSRTQKQIEQMVAELQSKTLLNPRMAILGSREFYCVNPKASSWVNKNEECMNLMETKSCDYFEGAKTLSGKLKFKTDIWDIEDLVTDGKKNIGCPYYASKYLAETADVIFAPYNYLIDPIIRASSGIDLKDHILIIDEAHNIEQTATDSSSIECLEIELQPAIDDLKNFQTFTKINTEPLQSVLVAFCTFFNSHRRDHLPFKDSDGTKMKIWPGEDGMQLLLDAKLNVDRLVNMVENLKDISQQDNQKDARLKVHTKTLLSNILMVLENLFIKNHSSDFRMVLSNGRGKSKGHFELKISFWCLNSGVVFADIGKDCRSVILMSGTLSPLSSYRKELGIEFESTVEAMHVIKPDQIWARAIPSGPNGQKLVGTYEYYTQNEYQDTLGLSILRLVENMPNGVLVFVSSYHLLETLRSRWTLTGVWERLSAIKKVFEEPRKGNADTANGVYKKYSIAAKGTEGAIMFCVYRGKMSEGMDFADELARLVICAGIPFPSRKDPVMKEKLDYHDKHSSDKNISNGDEWYETLAFRAINQALGRCIRHRNDWGAIALLDARFYKEKYLKQLPKWFQRFIKGADSFDIAETDLSEFLATRKFKSDTKPAILLPSQVSNIDVGNSENDSAPPTASYDQERSWKCSECSQVLLTSNICKLYHKSMLYFDSSEVFGVGLAAEFVGTERSRLDECLQTGLVHDQMCNFYSCQNCNETIGFSFHEELVLIADKTTFG